MRPSIASLALVSLVLLAVPAADAGLFGRRAAFGSGGCAGGSCPVPARPGSYPVYSVPVYSAPVYSAPAIAPAFVPPAAPITALDVINAGRVRAGSPPLALDARLSWAAGRHAADLAAGRLSPHEDLVGRVAASGWPVVGLGDRDIPFGNYSEGVFLGGGWPGIVAGLVSEGGRATHGGDFREPRFDRVGIGESGFYKVLDYGASGGTPPPVAVTVPGSEPVPRRAVRLAAVPPPVVVTVPGSPARPADPDPDPDPWPPPPALPRMASAGGWAPPP